ncbi:hypothetical protein KFL_001960120 [Klebsormidium nitens]|uniref:carotenoid 9,10-dioxygenase n=1 Tax=Klebsormidium nitens TaxID=105231 RepID=A0A1Y1I102_KLENI|nr:hypothetical protein KFL_001960120 [Klebsormidium nitens]|eukprot:GAQ84595.1 hypothetical protein KFL_001960120 [Klebsormidium nitens]
MAIAQLVPRGSLACRQDLLASHYIASREIHWRSSNFTRRSQPLSETGQCAPLIARRTQLATFSAKGASWKIGTSKATAQTETQVVCPGPDTDELGTYTRVLAKRQLYRQRGRRSKCPAKRRPAPTWAAEGGTAQVTSAGPGADVIRGPCTHIAKGTFLSENQRKEVAEVFAHHGGKLIRSGQLLQALAAIGERWSKQEAEKALHEAGGSLDSVDALDRLLHDVSAAATAVQMCLPGNEESTRVLRPLMSRRVYKRGETLVNQGEIGTEFFALAAGSVSVIKDGQRIGGMRAPDYFGELALHTQAPRAVTIQAADDVTVYVLREADYAKHIKEQNADKRAKYGAFLASVPLLKDMEPYDRLKLCDALKEQQFQDNELIIQEGEDGARMYIVTEGEVVIVKSFDSKQPVQVAVIKPGGFFGERSIVKSERRAASALCHGPVQCVSLDRLSFLRMLQSQATSGIIQNSVKGYRTAADANQVYTLGALVSLQLLDAAAYEDEAYAMEVVEGHVPTDLDGVLYRNGPASLKGVGGWPLNNPVDGDGCIAAFSFSRGKVYLRKRVVRTSAFEREKATGKSSSRGAFGTVKDGGYLANLLDLRVKNAANTNVVFWGGRLLALWEAGLPHELDPETLETRGVTDLNGALTSVMYPVLRWVDPPFQPAFAAHPRIDPVKKRFVSFGATTFPHALHDRMRVTCYEWDADWRLVFTRSVWAPFTLLHDFCITPNYYVFLYTPGKMDLPKFILDPKAGIAGAVKFSNTAGGEIMLVSRHHPTAPPQTFKTAPLSALHHANAFEDGLGNVVLDTLKYMRIPMQYLRTTSADSAAYPPLEFLPASNVVRLRLDLNTKQTTIETLDKRNGEFAAIHPERVGYSARFIYTASCQVPEGGALFDALRKVDTSGKTPPQIWGESPTVYVGEPVFVPRGGQRVGAPFEEDAGWVLILLYDTRSLTTDLAVFDAKDITKGPVARLRCRHNMAYGLHGTWAAREDLNRGRGAFSG